MVLFSFYIDLDECMVIYIKDTWKDFPHLNYLPQLPSNGWPTAARKVESSIE